MKIFIIFLFIFSFISPAQSSQQKNLNNLFSQLQNINNSKSAALLEKKIWSIWSEHPNDNKLTEKLEFGTKLMHYGDYNYALKVFDNIIITDPQWSEAWNKRATLYFLMKKFTNSLEDIEKVLSLEPRHFGALSGQARIFIKLQKYEDAIKFMEKRLLEIDQNKSNNLIWVLEHEDIYTAGTTYKESEIIDKSINDFQFEWKWDGIRIQLIKRSGKVSIWTRGQDLVNKSFPELVEKISSIKDDFVIDGELLVWDFKQSLPLNFSLLQKRINRKAPSRSIQKSLPIIFIAYDLLEINGEDQRDSNLEIRRNSLEKHLYNWLNESKEELSNIFKISDLIYPKNWEEVETFKNNSRDNGTEGLVIKNKKSIYTPGRKKGLWWKYKVDPMQLDAVLIYAKGGSGIRAGLYTDYSFALWKDGELIKFASAYSGLNNTEIKELDRWIRQNTIDRFGPVRSVRPEMVFEISFENIQISKRHKSGIAVRFPRITKWRKDKLIKDADTLENAEKLMLNK